MTDPAINEFFQRRKEAWLKENTKKMTEHEKKMKETECKEKFSLEQWLPDAAKRAGQMSIATHPCTFSHPSARKNKNGYVTAILANSKGSHDGFLRSGNVTVEADALGNAAVLDVYEFLTLLMEDNRRLLTHIEKDSDLAVQLLEIKAQSYQALKTGFLAMKKTDSDNVTSSKIKQVYFPVDDDYHQLSLLTASSVVFELKKRVNNIRFSEEVKEARAREKSNEMYPDGYRELYNITVIGYGGTKPQNISVLNNRNGGKAYLLPSAPPSLKTRDIHFPGVDFFSQSLNYFQCKDLFYALHKLFLRYENNWRIRAERDEYYQAIIDRIIEKMWSIRSVAQEQFNPDSSRLNKTQKIWLCAENAEKREQEDGWLDELIKDITSFIFNGYEKILGKKAVMFSDTEFKHIHAQVVKNKEALR